MMLVVPYEQAYTMTSIREEAHPLRAPSVARLGMVFMIPRAIG